MPRYFFNVIDGTSVRDLEGTELPGSYAAQTQAVCTSGEILRDIGARLWDDAVWSLEVTDERGQVLFALHVSTEERLPLPVSEPSLLLGPPLGPPPGPAPRPAKD